MIVRVAKTLLAGGMGSAGFCVWSSLRPETAANP